MPCKQTNHDHNQGNGSGPHEPGSANSPDGPYLIVTNAPETILAAHAGQTLYKCEIDVKQGAAQRFRVFLWHKNGSGGAVTLSAWLSLDQEHTAEVSDVVVETGTATADLSTLGICLAKVQLYQSFDTAVTWTDPITGSETPLAIYTVANGELRGSVIEFTVEADADCKLRFRSGIGGNWGSTVAAAGAHIRGWWPKSEITLPFETVTIDADPTLWPQYAYAGVCESNGPEVSSMGFAWQGSTVDPHGKANKGLYGANIVYELEATNSHSTMLGGVVLEAEIRQNTDPEIGESKYWGAGKIWLPSGHSDKGIPVLRYYDPQNGYNSLNNRATMGSVEVTAAGEVVIKVKVANGGAAALPFNLRATTLPEPP